MKTNPTSVVIYAGPSGAGKTRLVQVTVDVAITSGLLSPAEIGVIVNEVGGEPESTSRVSRIVLSNGCATCQDESVITGAMERLLAEKAAKGETLRLVLYEGFGTVGAGEVARTFVRAGYNPHVIGVLNGASDIDRNLIFRGDVIDYGEVLSEQVREATIGVVVTQLTRPSIPPIIDQFIGRHRSGKEPIPVLPSRDGVPQIPVEWIRNMLDPAPIRWYPIVDMTMSGLGSISTPGRIHHQLPMDPFSFQLKQGVTARQIRDFLTQLLKKRLVRAKGGTPEKEFSVAFGGQWIEYERSSRIVPNRLVMYLRPGATVQPDVFYRDIADMPINNTSTGERPQSYEQLRRLDVPVADLIRRNRALQKEVATLTPYVTPDGVLVTHPEKLQNLKESARREGVSEHCLIPALITCVDYWLRAIELLDDSNIRPEHYHKACLELAVSLAWWTSGAYADQLPPELVLRVVDVKPAVIVAQGILSLTALRPNLWWWYWQVEELKKALEYRGNFTPDNVAQIAQGTAHFERLKSQPITIV